MRSGTIAIVGRSNVGKSTFLNRVLEEPLAIVSPLPQTTRDNVLGVVRRAQAELAFLDTPGLHRPRSELGRRMNAAAREAARSADVVMFMTDVSALDARVRAGQPSVREQDVELLKTLPDETPHLLVVNKVDTLRDKTRLLPLLVGYQELRDFAALVPISVQTDDGVERVLDALAELLPEGDSHYEEDVLTDRPTRFFVSEYVREQVLLGLRGEIPHAVAVSIDEFGESERMVTVKATIHVEKLGQRKILVGTGGAQIKAIRVAAQARIARLVGRKVHLELFVRITPRWKEVPRMLAELGYADGARKTRRSP
ncbi:MAG TPA: GTPase Era [Polyangiaceae bacterium]|jgi:GTP-binding protein Era